MRRLCVLTVSLILTGCGESTPTPPDFGSDDGQAVAVAVEEFNEAKADAAKFRQAFAGKTALSFKKYDPYNFNLVGSPVVNGSEATAEVVVRSDVDQKEHGKVTWTFVKDGPTWKLKDAPLP